MKKIIFLTLILTTIAGGANEIRSFDAGAATCFAVIREVDGDVWYVTGEVFEAWGTGARTAADYDISLTDKTGGMFVGDFDGNISTGYYYIVTHQQEGGSPADTDPAVWQEYGYWSGSAWISGPSASDIDSIPAQIAALNDPNVEDIRREIDANSTKLATILQDTSTDIPSSITALNDISVAEIWDAIVEGTYTYKDFMRLLASKMFWKVSGGGTTIHYYRDSGDTKTRITETIDANGNRTDMVVDPDD